MVSPRPEPLNRLDFYEAQISTERRIVTLASRFPTEEDMRSVPAIFSAPAAFLVPDTDGTFSLRCFDAADECFPDSAMLISVFTLARDVEREAEPGTYNVLTSWGYITVNVGEDAVWLEVPAGTVAELPEGGPLCGFSGPDGREFIGGTAIIAGQPLRV